MIYCTGTYQAYIEFCLERGIKPTDRSKVTLFRRREDVLGVKFQPGDEIVHLYIDNYNDIFLEMMNEVRFRRNLAGI